MVGMRRLDNLQACIETAVGDGVPGDLIETGVWRGGATIFMRGVLKALGSTDRTVWVADSFQGLAPPNPALYPDDAGDAHHEEKTLRVSLDQVRANFACFDLLDEQVQFLEGWFRDTLHVAPIEQLAVLRLDGDMYESTWQALGVLYPKLAVGGFAIVDDFGLPACRRAVEDYRLKHDIDEPMDQIDWTGVFWRKTK